MTIAIIGAGAVGSTVAYALSLKNIAARILLIDVNEAKEEGEVMDIADSLCHLETGCVAGANFADARNADIIVITAGLPQKTGETRLDLARKNIGILRNILRAIGRVKKTACVLMIANPVDILTRVAQTMLDLPTGQIFGTGTALDTARLKVAVAEKLSVNPQSVHGYVLGEHGDSGFVAWSSVHAGGVPVSKIKELTEKNKRAVEKRVREEAYEIIKRKGATYFGIATTASDIIEAIVHDQHKIIPVSTYLKKWNGIHDTCLGAPAVIGAAGVERVWPLSLTAGEQTSLRVSARALRALLPPKV